MTIPDEPQTLFDEDLADEAQYEKAVSPQTAQAIFDYFKSSPLFRWSDANNDCEDRANAICILLADWGYTASKAWVFSGNFRQKSLGYLTNFWKYHVAAAIPVQEADAVVYYVIDPATSPQLITVAKWALQVTAVGSSYHFIKHGHYYIFPNGRVIRDNWHKRNKRNFNWTMQGLSGINGVSATGRAQLAFCKKKVAKTVVAFRRLRTQPPSFEAA